MTKLPHEHGELMHENNLMAVVTVVASMPWESYSNLFAQSYSPAKMKRAWAHHVLRVGLD